MLSMFAGDAYNVLLSKKIKPMLFFCHDFPIDHNRNKSVKFALEMYKADYLMQFDADQTFKQDTVTNLLERLEAPAPDGSQVEIVAGMYYLKAPPFRPVMGRYTGWEPEAKANQAEMEKHGFVCHGECGDPAHKDGEAHQLMKYQPPHFWPDDRMFRVDVIGVGCALSRASMWEKLRYPYFAYAPNFKDGHLRNFANEISEDMSWCAQMHRAGVKVWVDPRVQSGHIGILEADKSLYDGHFEAARRHLDALPDSDPLRQEFMRNLLDLR
jgi:hypothetical protein